MAAMLPNFLSSGERAFFENGLSNIAFFGIFPSLLTILTRPNLASFFALPYALEKLDHI